MLAGWGIATLAEAPWQASLRRLEARTAAMWASRRSSLLSLGAVAFAVTLGLGLLTAVLLSRSLARPLTEMSRAAGEIAAGNLDHPLTLDSPDELGDLARALNRMSGDLRAHEEARRAERADLAAKNAELERFTYTVSHDLKSPLVTIRGFAGLAGTDLAAGKLDRVRQDLGRIVAASDRMQRLLEDLLDLSRVGRVVNPAEDVALGPLAREAVELVRGLLDQGGVEVEIAPGLPVVRADRRRLLEVFQNLVENAAKFSPESRGPVSRSAPAATAPSRSSSCGTTGAGSSLASWSASSSSSRSWIPGRTGPGWASPWCGASWRPTAAASGPSRTAPGAARPSASRSPRPDASG